MSGFVLPIFWTRFLRSATALLLAVAFTLAAGGLSPARADASPFQVSVTPSASTVASGQQLSYVFDVKNTGGDITTLTTLNSQLQGLTGLVVSSNVGACTQSNNQLTCTAGILQGFQSWQVTVRGTVTAANGTTLNQGVTVTGNHTSNGYETTVYSAVLVNNNATGPLPNLTTSVQAPASVQDNTATTFQVTVNNAGSVNAVDVTEFATLPDGFSYLSATGNSLFSCANQPVGSQTVVCSGGRVNSGANATITIVANANNQVAGAQLKFTAVVDPYDLITETNELDNTGSAAPTSAPDPVQTQLTISKTDSPDPLRPGDKLTYTIQVKNIATTRADNLSMSDTTQGLAAASVTATTDRGVCTVAAAKVTCTQKSPTLRLDPGQAMNVTITGTVVASANSLVTNVATATAVIKNIAVTRTSATTTTVRPGVDLTVVQAAVNSHDDIPSTTGNNDWFRAYDHFQYDVSIGNSGMDDARNVFLREVVAPGVKYLGHDENGDGIPDADSAGLTCGQTTTGSAITCTIGLVAGSPTYGTTRNFSLLVVSPPSTGAITATATVDPGNAILESDETNNVSTVTTQIDTGIDLTVTKTSPPKVAPSGTLIYTIVVTNLGTQDASGIRLRDILPDGTRFRSVHELIAAGDPGHNFTCSHDGSAYAGDVTCVGGNLRGTHDHNLLTDSVTIELKAFAPAAPGIIRNQVKVDPNGEIAELLESNNFNTFDTQISIDGGCCAYQELNLTKTQVFPTDGSGPIAVKPSGIVEYDLKVKNDGTQVAFGVTVQDIMPGGFSYRYATDTVPGTGAFQCGVSGQTITCTGGTLDGTDGQTALAGDTTRTIHVSLFASSQPGTYTNTATVDPANTIAEADETNNSATATTTVAMSGGGDYIDFKIDSKQTSPGTDGTPVVPHGILRYNLDVTNAGTAVAYNVQVRDVLPTGSQFRSATDTGPTTGNFSCTESGGVISCSGGTLDGFAGPDETVSPSTRTIVIEMFAPTNIDSYSNVAVVDPNNLVAENDETNNTDQTVTDVRRNGGGTYQDLTVVSVTPSTTTPQPGEEYTYAILVKNTGTNPVFNVKLSNILDAGPKFVSATASAGSNFSCGVTDSVVTCTGGVLDGSLNLDAADDNATITLTVKAPQRHSFAYDLRSFIDPDNAVAESDEANNTGSATVTVTSQVNLKFNSLTSSGSKGNTGDVSWTLANTGTAAATDVYVVVNMSVGSIPQQMSGIPTGWTCQVEADPINKVTCHGDLAAGGTADFKVDTYVTADSPKSNGFVDPDHLIVETNEADNAAFG